LPAHRSAHGLSGIPLVACSRSTMSRLHSKAPQ
jgi:hypothetical protein